MTHWVKSVMVSVTENDFFSVMVSISFFINGEEVIYKALEYKSQA